MVNSLGLYWIGLGYLLCIRESEKYTNTLQSTFLEIRLLTFFQEDNYAQLNSLICAEEFTMSKYNIQIKTLFYFIILNTLQIVETY